MGQRPYRPTGLPPLPPGLDSGLRAFLLALTQTQEVQTAQRGSVLDAAPTFRDLVSAGLLNLKDGVSIQGVQYSGAALLNLWESTIPDWVTSDTAPPPPTGLAVGTDRTNVLLTWDPTDFDQYLMTQVWRATSNNLSVAAAIGSTTGETYVDSLPPAGTIYYYWIRDLAQNGLLGPFNAVSGTATGIAPGAPAISSTFYGAFLELAWPTPTSTLAVQYYEVRYDGVSSIEPLAVVGSNSLRFAANWSGARTFRVRAYDIAGNVGPESTVTVTVSAPSAPAVSQAFEGGTLVLTWPDLVAPADSTLPIDHYEIYDTSVATENLLSLQYTTRFSRVVDWTDLSKTLIVRAVDSAGNAGAQRSVVVTVTLADAPATFESQVIDNNVLLTWADAAGGSLPTANYELRRGDDYDTAEVVGDKQGNFTVLFETVAGTYTYWIAARNSVGVLGAARSLTATVSAPPDYIFTNQWQSSYAGASVVLSNAVADSTGVVMPINVTETWAAHFTARGWATSQDQIDAGYPAVMQPAVSAGGTGYYQEDFDAGSTISAMKVTVDYLVTALGGGSPSVQCDITTSDNSSFSGGSTTVYSNATQAFATNFRYIRIRLTTTAPALTDVAKVSNVQVRLDAKLVTASGMATVTSADTYTDNNGTAGQPGYAVYLTKDGTSTGEKVFRDVTSISVAGLAASGSSGRLACYHFIDVPDPLCFGAMLFSNAATRQNGTVSYIVRGY